MSLPFNFGLNNLETFILILVRMTGLFVIAPIFGRNNIPTYLKVGFSFFLALILTTTVKVTIGQESESILSYVAIVIKEFAVGIILGYVSYLMFSAVYLAGQMIDTQIGLGMVNVIDPVNSIQIPVTANFYYILSMMLFLTANGHHILIKALFDSYSAIPVGRMVLGTGLVGDLGKLLQNIFFLGFKISAPIIAVTLIVDVAMGIIMKTIPQLNVFVAGVPLKIFIGFIFMWLTIPMFILVIDMIIKGMNSEITNIIKNMAPS